MTELNENTLIDDLEAIADLMEGAGVADRVRLGTLPKKLDNGGATVRTLPIKTDNLTYVSYQQIRPYQIILYDENVPKLLDRMDKTLRLFSDTLKIPVKDGYLSIDRGIGFSETLLDEDESSYFTIGVVEAYVNRNRPQEKYDKVQEIEINSINDEEI